MPPPALPTHALFAFVDLADAIAFEADPERDAVASVAAWLVARSVRCGLVELRRGTLVGWDHDGATRRRTERPVWTAAHPCLPWSAHGPTPRDALDVLVSHVVEDTLDPAAAADAFAAAGWRRRASPCLTVNDARDAGQTPHLTVANPEHAP